MAGTGDGSVTLPPAHAPPGHAPRLCPRHTGHPAPGIALTLRCLRLPCQPCLRRRLPTRSTPGRIRRPLKRCRK